MPSNLNNDAIYRNLLFRLQGTQKLVRIVDIKVKSSLGSPSLKLAKVGALAMSGPVSLNVHHLLTLDSPPLFPMICSDRCVCVAHDTLDEYVETMS